MEWAFGANCSLVRSFQPKKDSEVSFGFCAPGAGRDNDVISNPEAGNNILIINQYIMVIIYTIYAQYKAMSALAQLN